MKIKSARFRTTTICTILDGKKEGAKESRKKEPISRRSKIISNNIELLKSTTKHF